MRHANTFHVYCSQVTIYKANPVVFQNGKKAGDEKLHNDIFTQLGRSWAICHAKKEQFCKWFISVVDLDESLVDYDIINDYSDNAYVVFRLPNDMTLLKNEKITVTLFPSTGITRTTVLKAPMPMSSVITFE